MEDQDDQRHDDDHGQDDDGCRQVKLEVWWKVVVPGWQVAVGLVVHDSDVGVHGSVVAHEIVVIDDGVVVHWAVVVQNGVSIEAIEKQLM